MHRVVATCAIALVTVVSTAPAKQASPRSTTPLEELLWWLPENTETIMATQVPTRVASGPLFEELANLTAEIKLGDTPYAETMMRHLRSARLRGTLEGSRHFLPPSGLGEMRYEGATLYLFEKPLGATANALMTELKKTALSVEQIQNVTVVAFRDRLENDTWNSFIALPRPDVLVSATSRQYLKELLARVGTRPARRALPDTLPEWRWVDVNSPFWAVRHYRHDYAQSDPTSPFRKGRGNSAADLTFDAVALGLTAYASDDGRTVLVRYLSKSAKAEQLASRIFTHPGDGVSPSVRKIADETIEVRFTAKDGEHLSMFLFYLFAALGHATFL